VGEIYPDFISEDGSFVLDAKYKFATGIHAGDYKQMLTYMLRFGVQRGCYLHPAPLAGDGRNRDDNQKLIKLQVLSGVDASDFGGKGLAKHQYRKILKF
jgi:hypothetical protein